MTIGAPRSKTVPEHPAWLTGLGLSTFVALDLETTGFDPGKDDIIEIGAVRFVDGEPRDSFQSLVQTDRSLDENVSALIDIDADELKRAPLFSEVVARLLDFLRGDPIVGVSTDLHLAFLRIPGKRSAVTGVHFAFSQSPVLDAAMVARVFWPELPSFSLVSLARHFGIRSARSNRAYDDALTAGHLLSELVFQLPSRVWHELALDLYRLIGSTTHRSRFFFAALAGLATTPAVTKVVRPEVENESEIRPSDSDAVSLLGEKGPFAARLDFFEPRPVQLRMAEAVDEAFGRNEILLVEAPTGVGKSLAYLVPALRWALDDPAGGRQVVVSSQTRMLQEQLHRKDISAVRRAVDQPFRSAVLKGRSNYLCRRRLKLLLREAGERLSEVDRIQMMPLLRWAGTTVTGDIAEISAFGPQAQANLWAQVSSDASACAGSACGAGKGDFHRLAQERASKAHLLFVNHALLFSDLARLTSRQPERRRFVLDEAHQIERAAVAALTIEIGSASFRNVLGMIAEERAARGLLPALLRSHRDALSDKAERLATDLMERCRSLFLSVRQDFATLGDRLLEGSGEGPRVQKRRFRKGDVWHREIVRTLGPLHIQWVEFGNHFGILSDELGERRGEDRLAAELLVEFRSTSDRVTQLGENLERLLHEDDDSWVNWAEAGQTDHAAWCTLSMAPITVGGLMGSAFWSAVGSAVLTSATLSTAGDFTLVKSSLGLSADSGHSVRELTLASPYNLDRQMKMVVPTFLPDPRGNEQKFVAELGDLISQVLKSTRRATVILCTSSDTVERLANAVKPIARQLKRPLFSQSRGSSTPELLAEYRKHRDGILIGAATFWEGIDLIGDALEILVVSKIPFDVPIDPWVSARCDSIQQEGRDSFSEFMVPAATLRMKQGIGRLIRHPRDRGVAILADPRLFMSRYGGVIRGALPGVPLAATTPGELLTMLCGFFGDGAQ